ncbi:MAG: Rieske 2Fe-2S domain-containing protein [Acidobacteria bacterium]|nr:Rieske 2Fe-2S domain-containing protein [Acidobacteriota bacterium]
MTSIFEIDPDITRAGTLHSDFYTDPEYFALSKERIFARTWHFLGRARDFEGVRPVTLLPGILDDPLMLVKTVDSLHCMSNVCTHRGKLLIEEACRPDLIRCGYHGRRFSLDGKFMSMPEFEGATDFPSAADDLPHIPLAVRLGFIFGSANPIASFDEYIADASGALSGIKIVPGGLRLTATREYEINAHWALYCENYLEGFHIPYVHRGLNAVVDYGTYSTETFRYSSVQTGFGSDGTVAARYLFVFPNLMFNFYPWGVSVNVVRPVSPDSSVIEFLTYVSDDSLIDQGAGADLHSVEMEDEAVVESVQKGIRSRYYSQGRYSPNREQGTHHFHRLIAEFMSR